jgi:hypothetical protein
MLATAVISTGSIAARNASLTSGRCISGIRRSSGTDVIDTNQ